MRLRLAIHYGMVSRIAVLALSLLVTPCVFAAATDWQWGGFLSQAGVYTSDNDYFGNTDNRVSGSYGETGIIVNGALLKKFDFAAQVIGRRAGELSEGSPKFDYINLSYRFYEGMSATQGIRFGKLKAPIGLYNETREVPFTRPGIFMPQGIYWEKMRNTRSFFDGAQYFYEFNGEINSVNLRLGVGQVKADQREFNGLMGIDGYFEFSSLETRQFAIAHEYDGGRIRSSFTSAAFQSDINATDLTRAFIDGKGDIRYRVDVLSLEYNALQWTLTGEYMLGKNVTGFPGNFFSTVKEYPEASYLQYTYHAGASYDYFVRYESQRADSGDPDGTGYIDTVFSPLAPILPALGVKPSPAHSRYSFDKTIGFAWKPSTDLMFRAEWHRVIGTSEVANYLFNKKTLTKEWDLVAIQLSYRFR